MGFYREFSKNQKIVKIELLYFFELEIALLRNLEPSRNCHPSQRVSTTPLESVKNDTWVNAVPLGWQKTKTTVET